MLSDTVNHLDKEIIGALRRLGFSYPSYAGVASFDYANRTLSAYYQNVFSGLIAWKREATQLGEFSQFVNELISGKLIDVDFKLTDADMNTAQFFIAKQMPTFKSIILRKGKHARVLAARAKDLQSGRIVHYDKNLVLKSTSKEAVSSAGFSIYDKPAVDEVKALVILKKSRIPIIDAIVADRKSVV